MYMYLKTIPSTMCKFAAVVAEIAALNMTFPGKNLLQAFKATMCDFSDQPFCHTDLL